MSGPSFGEILDTVLMTIIFIWIGSYIRKETVINNVFICNITAHCSHSSEHHVKENIPECLSPVPTQVTRKHQLTARRVISKTKPPISKRRGPLFIILGQAKCGTDSLFREISHHPDFVPLRWALYRDKEVHFFNKFWSKGADWYLNEVMPDLEGDNFHFTGEASPPYGYLPGLAVMKRIRETVPDVKLIISIRDPLERAESWCRYQNVRRIRHNTVVQWTKALDGCLETQSTPVRFNYKCMEGLWLNVGKWPSGMTILTGSLYSQLILKVLEFFPANQLKVIRFEDFTDPHKHEVIMDEVYRFLKVRRVSHVKHDMVWANKGGIKKSKVWRSPRETRKYLQEWFNRYDQYGLKEILAKLG